MKQKEKRSGCCLFKLVKWFLCFLAFTVVIALFVGNDSDKDTVEPTIAVTSSTATTSATEAPVDTPTYEPVEKATAEPTEAPNPEPFEIVLKWPDLGEYGVYYTFNENIKKAEESDRNTVIQCFVPAGVYTVTNVDCSPWTFLYTYSKETVISENGWEEPADGWTSPMLKPGESCEVTIPEGWYIKLQENDNFKLVLK